MVAMHWEKYFQHICEKYNSIYKVQMPKITPHVCRHTYCSNLPFILRLKAKIYQVMPGYAKMKRIRYAGKTPGNRINTVFIRSLMT